jgi:hypothetical protein
VVTVQDKAAERTGIDPIRKRFIYSFTTPTAVDACASGRNFLYPATSFFSFVREKIEKLAPAGIGQILGG